MLSDLSALREKGALKVREIMRRANVVNEEACQSLLLKMRDEGLVKLDIQRAMAYRMMRGPPRLADLDQGFIVN
jgi:hypothetical protein